jgi:hypothetical protein
MHSLFKIILLDTDNIVKGHAWNLLPKRAETKKKGTGITCTKTIHYKKEHVHVFFFAAHRLITFFFKCPSAALRRCCTCSLNVDELH